MRLPLTLIPDLLVKNVSTRFVWVYLNEILDLQPPIKVLLDTARSALARSWFTQSLRVIQVPNAHLPFEVNMHDDAVLRLWKDHKGVESLDADLDAQWERRIVDPIVKATKKSKRGDVSIVSTGGRVILSASVRPHSVCALIAYVANLADASPFSYIGLSCKHPCYACYMFMSAYNQPDPRVPFYTLGPESEHFIPFAFPAFSDHDFNDTVRRRLGTMAEDDLWIAWDECRRKWYHYSPLTDAADTDDDDDDTGADDDAAADDDVAADDDAAADDSADDDDDDDDDAGADDRDNETNPPPA